MSGLGVECWGLQGEGLPDENLVRAEDLSRLSTRLSRILESSLLKLRLDQSTHNVCSRIISRFTDHRTGCINSELLANINTCSQNSLSTMVVPNTTTTKADKDYFIYILKKNERQSVIINISSVQGIWNHVLHYSSSRDFINVVITEGKRKSHSVSTQSCSVCMCARAPVCGWARLCVCDHKRLWADKCH